MWVFLVAFAPNQQTTTGTWMTRTPAERGRNPAEPWVLFGDCGGGSLSAGYLIVILPLNRSRSGNGGSYLSRHAHLFKSQVSNGK